MPGDATEGRPNPGVLVSTGRAKGNGYLNMTKDLASDAWAPPSQLLELDEHDSGLIAVLADAYEQDTKCRLERIRLAMATGDTRGLSAEAHSIKGGAWQMGASAVADMCFNLERNASHLTGAALAESVGTLETLFTENLRSIARYLAELEPAKR
jgi:HPt (histidine-containing phosphotransfer) domain-containing protein